VAQPSQQAGILKCGASSYGSSRISGQRPSPYALELDGGASNLTIILPTPAGTVPIRVARGVHDLTILRPAGVAARVQVGDGARSLTLDDQHFGAIGGSTRWQNPGYDQTTDRYDIAVSGGANTLTLHSRGRHPFLRRHEASAGAMERRSPSRPHRS
jgi:hypothetical protein